MSRSALNNLISSRRAWSTSGTSSCSTAESPCLIIPCTSVTFIWSKRACSEIFPSATSWMTDVARRRSASSGSPWPALASAKLALIDDKNAAYDCLKQSDHARRKAGRSGPHATFVGFRAAKAPGSRRCRSCGALSVIVILPCAITTTSIARRRPGPEAHNASARCTTRRACLPGAAQDAWPCRRRSRAAWPGRQGLAARLGRHEDGAVPTRGGCAAPPVRRPGSAVRGSGGSGCGRGWWRSRCRQEARRCPSPSGAP